MSRVAIFGDIFSGFFRLSRKGPLLDPDLSHFRRFRLKGRFAPGIASKRDSVNLGPNGGRRKLETKSLREAFFSDKKGIFEQCLESRFWETFFPDFPVFLGRVRI